LFFFFLKWYLLILFFSYWSGWYFSFIVFLKQNTVDCYSVFPTCFFFLNYLCLIYFFNIELVENLALPFPTCFFSHFFLFFFYFWFFIQNCLFFPELFLLI
jgi:hypothetical protein